MLKKTAADFGAMRHFVRKAPIAHLAGPSLRVARRVPPRQSGIRMHVAALCRPAAASLVVGWSAFAGCAFAQSSSEHTNHEQPGKELVLFLRGEAHHLSSSTSPNSPSEDSWFSADIVLALTRDRFRVFGEYLVEQQEHDLERLQLGYEVVPNTVAWIGRFHQPASAWNTEHHHGRYLQTSITRPSVELWEDEDGIIPQHIAGVLVDSRQTLGDHGGLEVSAGAGLGPRIEEKKLEPLDLVDPHEAGRHISWLARVAYQPDFFGASAFGVVAARHRIPVMDGSIVNFPLTTEVRQDIYGAFAYWSQEPWRVVATVYDVHLGLLSPAGTRGERFLTGYVEADRELPHSLVAFGRVEDTSRASRSAYLTGNHPDFEVRRLILGLRWDLRPRQALTVEAGRGETSRGHQNEIRLQWSAALP